MKLSIVGLFVLGLFAALCAAVLIALLSVRRPGQAFAANDPEVTVLVARQDIATSTMIDGNLVIEKKLPRSKVPDLALSASVQAIGKVTSVPVLEGQAFRKDMFVTEGSGPQLAASFTPGKRAVAISLTEAAGLDGVLYPGSVVDVILTVKSHNNDQPSRSRTVLEAVPVLAIERQTVIAKDAEKQDGGESKRFGTNARRVTLLVDSKQATIVQLALNEGTLSLAMRNPLDKKTPDRSPVSMAQLMPKEESNGGFLEALAASLRASAPQNPPMAHQMPMAAGPNTASLVPLAKPKPAWETTVIRANHVETVEFSEEQVNMAHEGT